MNFVSVSQTAIDETAGLARFYQLTEKLSKTRRVKFVSKNDDADNIDWNFRYRGHKLTLQYSIYNGVSLFSNETSGAKLVDMLASNLMQA